MILLDSESACGIAATLYLIHSDLDLTLKFYTLYHPPLILLHSDLLSMLGSMSQAEETYLASYSGKIHEKNLVLKFLDD